MEEADKFTLGSEEFVMPVEVEGRVSSRQMGIWV